MAKEPGTLELRFPVGGQARRYGYQQQTPETTHDCRNVRPSEPLEGRERGGSRPGLSKFLSGELGASAVQLDGVDQYLRYSGAAFDPGTGDFALGCALYLDSTAAAGGVFSASTENVANDFVWIYVTSSAKLRVRFNDSSNPWAGGESSGTLSTDTWYTLIVNFDRDGNAVAYIDGAAFLTVDISGHNGDVNPGSLTIGAYDNGTNNFSGRIENAFYANRLLTADEIAWLHNSGEWRRWAELGSAGTNGSALTNSAIEGFYEFQNSSYFGRDSSGNAIALTAYNTPTQGVGTRAAPVQCLAPVTVIGTDGQTSDVLAAVADGAVYHSTSGGAWTKAVATLNSSAPVLRATAHHQKLYIADYRPVRIFGTDGVIGASNQLSAPSVSDWSTLEIDTDLDVIVVAGTPGGVSEDDVYAISAVASGYITINATLTAGTTYSTGTVTIVSGVVTLAAGTFPSWAAEGRVTVAGRTYTVGVRTDDTHVTLDDTTVNVGSGASYSLACPVVFELGRAIQEFDPTDNTLSTITATFGIPPVNCPLICTYRDRLVVANGNTWYMSRQGNVTDWDYSYTPDDAARPVAGSVSDAGYVGSPVVAMIPHSDDYLIFGCEDEIWVLRGDPAGGGQIDSLSREVGIISADAWCKLPDAAMVFLSRQGIYVLAPGSDNYPEPFSRELLPEELQDIDTVANVVSMKYDGRHRGIHLFITPTDGTAGAHWWIDWMTKGFFPVVLPAAQQPHSLADYAASLGDAKHILLGGADGFVRRFDTSVATDDGTAITSYVKIGPWRMGSLGYEGILTELGSVLDESSGDVTWEVMTGDTAEGALASATARSTGTWGSGRNRPTHPRVRGGAAVLKLSSTVAWAMESAFGTVVDGGRQR